MIFNEELNDEEAFELANQAVYEKTGEYLEDKDKILLKMTWQGHKYADMPEYYTEETWKTYGKELWDKLSDVLGEKVSKVKLKTPLQRYKKKMMESKSINKNHNYNFTNIKQIQVSLKLEYPGGSVALDSDFYIKRDIEENCYNKILQPGALISIKASRYTGKTSLINRIINHAYNNNCKTISLDLETINQESLSSLDKFLRWFCAKVSNGLGIDVQLDNWNEHKELYGSNDCCTSYFEDYLLQHFDVPIVLAIDGLHKLFQYPEIYKDFFEILRYWHEKAKNLDIWNKLHIIVAYSTTEAFLKLKDNQSPFNVGYPANLPDFNTTQIKRLIQLYGLNFTDTQINQMEKMLGGHPYLTRLALYHIKHKDIEIESFLKNAATEGGIYASHLRAHLRSFQEDAELSSAFMQVITFNKDVQLDSILVYKLQKMGLVSVNGDQVTPRCDLYCNYFSNRLKA